MFRISSILLVLAVTGGLGTAGWAKPWKLVKPSLSFSAPDGFQEMPKRYKGTAMELFHPKLNTELVISSDSTEKPALKTFVEAFPETIKAKGGAVSAKETIKSPDGPAALFVVTGLLPEEVESIYIYVVPKKRSPYSLIANYPAEKRQDTLAWLRKLVSTLRP